MYIQTQKYDIPSTMSHISTRVLLVWKIIFSPDGKFVWTLAFLVYLSVQGASVCTNILVWTEAMQYREQISRKYQLCPSVRK